MLDRVILCCVWLQNLKHQADIIMDIPNATTTTRTLNETGRRTNVIVLLVGRTW